MQLTAQRAREVLDYDPLTGDLVWKVCLNPRVPAGQKVTHIGGKGYITVGIDGKHYQAHRVAWLITYGVWPVSELDHDNQIRHDNRLTNLKDTTRLGNMKNRKKFLRNSSGHTGVYATPAGSWIARICVNKKQVNLGTFSTIAEAVTARQAANTQHDFHPNHGL